jgi:hypothetical protein
MRSHCYRCSFEFDLQLRTAIEAVTGPVSTLTGAAGSVWRTVVEVPFSDAHCNCNASFRSQHTMSVSVPFGFATGFPLVVQLYR